MEEILFKDSTIYVTPVEGYVYTEEVTSGGKTEEKSYKQTEDGSLTLYTAYLSNSELLPLLKEHKVAYTGYYEAEMNPILLLMINYILPVIIMVGLFMLLMRLMSKSGGGGFGGLGSVGKSNAKVYMEKSTGVTFKDVAGQDEAKESLEEIIDFLHNPGRYTAIGAKLPKGAPSPARASWRCSWAWAPVVSATCSRRRPRSPRASFLSMRSTPSARPETAASAAATTSGSRR